MTSARLATPYLAGLALLVGLPSLLALGLSFTEFTGVQAPEPVGLSNYQRLAGDEGFWRAAGNSAIYIALSWPVRLLAAVGLALLLHRRGAGAGAGRAAAYLPTVVPDVAYGLLWLWVLNPLYGPLSGAFTSIGIDSPDWLTDPWTARFSVALMSWFQIGEGFVIALAARRSIPASFYEAAVVERATPWYSMTRITLPVMAPAIALLAIRDLIYTFQANFVPALIVTGGAPRYATTFLPLYVYRAAFRYFRLGYASTMAVVMFALTAAAIYVQYRLARRWRLL